jgi:DNA-binding transcriptional LysR family regulator
MVIGNSEAICKAVQEGMGVAFVSCMVAADAIQARTLVPIEVEGMTLSQTIYMARNIERPATCAQTAFWDFAFSADNQDLRREIGEVAEPVG